MSTIPVVPCGCCKVIVEPEAAFFDAELQAHVCDECRIELKQAKAQLGRSFSAPFDGIPSMPICIRGAYHGPDAQDNHPLIPPARDL